MNEGIQTAIVEIKDPRKPKVLYPIYVAELIAMGPGVDSEIAIILENSSSLIHFFFFTNSFSNKATIAYPPPKVNSPIFNIVKNKFKYFFII